MKPRVLALTVALSCVIGVAGSKMCLADDGVSAKYVQTAEQAMQQQQYKKAELNWTKAIKLIETQEDDNLARALTGLTTAYRQQGKISLAAGTLARALAIYNKLGHVESDFVSEATEMGKVVKIADLERMGGPSARVLKENGGVVTLSKGADGGVSVSIDQGARLEKTLASQKLDGFQMETKVTFDLSKQADGSLHLANIKGFKIHSVEKNMWVNLLDLQIGQTDPDGKYNIVLTAGKAGITKTVDGKLPAPAYEPIAGIAGQLDSFGAPVQFALPVVTSVHASPASDATASSSSSSTSSSGSATSSSDSASAATNPAVTSSPELYAATTTNSVSETAAKASSKAKISEPPNTVSSPVTETLQSDTTTTTSDAQATKPVKTKKLHVDKDKEKVADSEKNRDKDNKDKDMDKDDDDDHDKDHHKVKNLTAGADGDRKDKDKDDDDHKKSDRKDKDKDDDDDDDD
ncbi:MAG: tetratricopeptide repeat protein [Candidatus Obscuribacterales bacterium]